MATLFGRYEYAGELGRGASGRVFAVLDHAAEGVRRAIKVVPPAESARLIWEFSRLCQVDHERLCRVRELVRLAAPAAAPFGLARGTLLLVQDFVEGAPLSRAIAHAPHAEARRELAARATVAVAQALVALHDSSLVHGDVKPDNVLCAADGQGATLIDLGFARPPALASVPRGTPAYMAPELFAGVCTPAADVYALGSLLYDCLRGELASADSGGSAARSHVPWRVRDLTLLELPAGDPLRRVLAELLRHDHTRRPQDARAALAQLLPCFAQWGLDLGQSALSYAALELTASPSERAYRARTLPFVGHEAELQALLRVLEAGGSAYVRGASGAGRSRLVREGIRRLQEQRAQAGQSVPTWVSSLSALALLRDVDAILWLGEDDAAPDEVRHATAAAALALHSLSVVVEGDARPALDNGSADRQVALLPQLPVIELGALSPDAFASLLESLLAPIRPAREVREAAHAQTQGLAGRLCELVGELAAAGRDLRDARVFEGGSALGQAAQRSAPASRLAVGLAWWGALLDPALAARWMGDEARLRRAYDELRGRGVLIESEGALLLQPAFAAAQRRAASPPLEPSLRSELVRASAAAQAPGRGLGFALLALGQRAAAQRAFVQEALALRAEGRSDAACALLIEARGWLHTPPDSAPPHLALLDHPTEEARADPAEALQLCLLHADAERTRGRYGAALAALGTTLPDAPPELCLLRAELLRMSERPDEAQAELAALTPLREPVVRWRVEAQRARLAFDAGRLDDARAHAARALAGDDREAQVRALEVEVLACLVTGQLAAAPVDALVARALAGPAVPTNAFLARAPARARSLRAQVRARAGERHEALADLRSAVALTHALGEAHEGATYALNLGLLELEAGELGRALETLRDAAQKLGRVARTRDLARVLLNFAALALLVGDFERAAAVLAQAERELASAPDPMARALLAVLRGELSLSRGELEATERVLEHALSEAPAEARGARALLAARAVLATLARGALERAESYCVQTRDQTPSEDASAVLELLAAELRLALARGELAAAEACAQRGLASLHDGLPFADRLRFVLAAIESARASGLSLAQLERSALARAWLERALASLPRALREKMRAVPAYARVLSSELGERSNERDESTAREGGASASAERWRTLVRASRRLFAETREARIVQRLSEIALELVHAERALVIAFDDKSELSVIARSELSGESDRARGFSRSVVEQVALDRRPLLTVEAGADARLDRAQSVAALQVRSVLCSELLGLRGRAFLYLDDRLRPSAFGQDDLALVEDLVELARQALRTGEELQREARRARRAEQHQKRLTRELARSSDTRPLDDAELPLIGDSAILRRVIATARRVAHSDAPVLITGESGTGKELLARFVHEASPRRARAFVAESCAAIPDTLLESALFGHVRGAFTGADRAHKGLFEAADGGTLLLDEVGEMSASLQGKLLRVLQEGELRPLGSERTRLVDVRVIGATRRDLLAMVAAGRFREDLYYRLAVVTLELPALRDRPEDVPQLVTHFLAKHAAGRNVQVAPSVVRELGSRPWPGNVRELENEVRRALAFSDGEIRLEHLTQRGPLEVVSDESELDLHAHTDRLLRKLVREALSRAEGNVTRAALLLGISRFGLQKILKRLQLSAR
jgi:serine/threonine-protein kinase PknK